MSIAYTGPTTKPWKGFTRRANINTGKLERSIAPGQLDLLRQTKGSSMVATKEFTLLHVTYKGGWCAIEGPEEALAAVMK